MINWFIYPTPMDISHEVASIMTSILAMSIMFIVFATITWCVVKVYTNTWKETYTNLMKEEKKPKNKTMDTRFLH